MQCEKWLKFLQDVVPDEKSREDLQKFLGAQVLGVSFRSPNLHSAFDQPCQDPGGLATKVVK